MFEHACRSGLALGGTLGHDDHRDPLLADRHSSLTMSIAMIGRHTVHDAAFIAVPK